MTDDDLTRIEAQARGGGYKPPRVNAERLALAAEVRRLRADLMHARMWANYECDMLPHFAHSHDAASQQASAYCWDKKGRDVRQNVTASDGWRVGQEVPE